MMFDYGLFVEDVVWYFNGNLFVFVGGEDVCVWDVIGGGRVFCWLCSYQKIIIIVYVYLDVGLLLFVFGYEIGSESVFELNVFRMIIGFLDGFVKIYEFDIFIVMYLIKYFGFVLMCLFLLDVNCFVIGLVNKVLSVCR